MEIVPPPSLLSLPDELLAQVIAYLPPDSHRDAFYTCKHLARRSLVARVFRDAPSYVAFRTEAKAAYVRHAVVSNGKRVVVGFREKSRNPRLEVWSLETGEFQRRWGCILSSGGEYVGGSTDVTHLVAIPGGDRCVVVIGDWWIVVYDAVTGPCELVEQSYSPVECVAVTPDAQRILVGCHDGSVAVHDVRDGVVHARTSQLHVRRVRYVAALPDGERCVSSDFCYEEGKFVVSELATGKVVSRRSCYDGNSPSITACAAVDDARVLCGNTYGGAKVWTADDERQRSFLHDADPHRHVVTAVVFLPGAESVLTASDDRTIRMWGWGGSKEGDFIKNFVGHKGGVMGVTVEGTKMVSSSNDGTVRVWKL